MRFSNIAMAAAALTGVQAQRPKDESICDYYTTALLKKNTAENQATLLTLVVNTVVIGNYTQPNVGIAVPGILAPGTVSGEKVNLLPYFSGALLSTNRGGSKGVSVNFLDGGGAAPLMKNMPANDKSSNQYFLLTHLYEFFGALLGCSMQGMTGFDAYMGEASMFEVHKFMDLDLAEVTYFIEQVGLAAASFGVAKSDVTAVGEALGMLFNYRCAPKTEVIPGQGAQLQSICVASDCPKAANATCDAYPMVMEPGSASNSSMPTSTMGSMPTGTGSSPTGTQSTVPTGAAAANGLSFAALAVGVAAFAL